MGGLYIGIYTAIHVFKYLNFAKDEMNSLKSLSIFFLLYPPKMHDFNEKISSECTTIKHLFSESFSNAVKEAYWNWKTEGFSTFWIGILNITLRLVVLEFYCVDFTCRWRLISLLKITVCQVCSLMVMPRIIVNLIIWKSPQSFKRLLQQHY